MRLHILSTALSAMLALSACDINPDQRGTVSTPQSPAVQGSERAAPSAAADAAVTDRVVAALSAIENLDRSAISVETMNGRVVLSGRVANQTQIDRAVSAAKGVDGVRDVESRLTVG